MFVSIMTRHQWASESERLSYLSAAESISISLSKPQLFSKSVYTHTQQLQHHFPWIKQNQLHGAYMGGVASAPRWTTNAQHQHTAEYLIGGFIGEISFPINSEFWQQLLLLPFDHNWPSNRYHEACLIFGKFLMFWL